MLEKGWCKFDVHRIDLITKGASTLYFLANLQPTRPGLDHSDCTEQLCTWMTINESYRTRHAMPDCQCESRFSEIGDVGNIIEESDQIPLIQEIHPRSDSQSSEFRIIPVQPSGAWDFVAISYVWAEGLGNPHANELPKCSLKWISSMVNSLGIESEGVRIPFWIDTLCIPIAPKEIRTRAMNLLRKPYDDAAIVLVLDSYLYTQDSTSLSPLEIWARVLCCSWSRRLWTFQEGRLAHKLLYQFAERAIPLEEVFFNLPDSLSAARLKTELVTTHRSANILRSIASRMPNSEKASATSVLNLFRPKPDVRDMRESLKARSVSVSYDEGLCLFCNMGLDMELVTGLEEEERMPTFWRHVKDIPVGLIFSTSREKLTRPGFRWAPASFMGDIDTPHWYLEQGMYPRIDGYPTANGLEIRVPGFLFDAALLKHDDSFDTLFSDCWLHVINPQDQTWYFIEMKNGFWNQSRPSDPKGGEQLAILTHKPIEDVGESAEGDPFGFLPGVMAVLGVVTEPASGGRPPKIEVYRHALLHRFSTALQSYLNMIQTGVELFVMEELGYVGESRRDGEGRVFQRFKAPEEPREENLDNFQLIDERRVLCQEYCTRFAEDNPLASDITLMCGYHEGRSSQQAFENFGKMARFMLQMRRRNRLKALDQTQVWCID